MDVQLSGAVVAALLHAGLASPGDAYGLLLGDVARHTTLTTADGHEQIARTSATLGASPPLEHSPARGQPTVRPPAPVVDGVVPLGGHGALFSAAGGVDAALVAAATPAGARAVGWFVCRRGTAVAPSLRERHLHAQLARAATELACQRQLAAEGHGGGGDSQPPSSLASSSAGAVAAVDAAPFVLAVVSVQSPAAAAATPANFAADYAFFQLDPDRRLACRVANLDQTVHGGYDALQSPSTTPARCSSAPPRPPSGTNVVPVLRRG